MRLNRHIKGLGCLKQSDEQLAEFNLGHGFAKKRCTGLPDHSLHFGRGGALRHPATFDMKRGNCAIILIKKSDQVFGEIISVFSSQLPDDGAIKRDVSRILGVSVIDQNVAGVHVCMEEVVLEDLCEKNLHP